MTTLPTNDGKKPWCRKSSEEKKKERIQIAEGEVMEESDKQRIRGRLWAEEVTSVLDDESEDFVEGFWRCIRKQAKQKTKTKKIDPKAMTDEESRAFGQSRVSFGKYKTYKVDDVPLDYWEWLADENNKIQRYLRSRRIQRERSEQ